jgi:Predicted membrane protein
MVEPIIYSLALAVVQLWALPASTRLSDLNYLLSSRDNAVESSVLQGRIQRAGANLQESLAPFLALCLLAIVTETDLEQAAWIWLIARAVYVPCYLLNILYVRSIVWGVSFGTLIFMASSLL